MKQKSGFTLIEMSVVLALIGVILYGSMSLLVVGVQTAQVNSTVATMDAIEKALLDFRVAFGRIPCPADITLTASSANYGVEAANTGTCTGGSPAANLIAASGTAEGGIPTRALRLPDSYMVDGWGHKLRYAVNPNYTITTSTTCSLTGAVSAPAITINDASGAARSTNAIYAIISHGANGHGAYTSSGAVINAGSTNADEHTNCHCDSTAAHTGGAGVLSLVTYVQKAPTEATAGNSLTIFDDIVAYKEFWQEMTPNLTSNSLGCTVATCPFYRTVTIDHTKVGAINNTDQTNFPMLFAGTYSYLATVANGGKVNNANGYDIKFTSDAPGTTLLNYEQESYNSTTGAVNYWVMIPTLSHTTDTVIYLQYCTANQTNQSNPTGTWDSNYMGVWHLDETSGNQLDSTSNANKFTTINVAAEGSATGIVNGADQFSSSHGDINRADTASLRPTTNLTVEAWTYLTTLPSASTYLLVDKTESASPWHSYYLYVGTTKVPAFAWENTSGSGFFAVSDITLSANTWYHLVGTYDGSNLKIYINGAVDPGSTASTSGTMNVSNNSNFQVGGIGGPQPIGNLDEIRVSNTNRSADWINTEYNNISAPDKATYGASGFYTIGSQTGR